MRTLATLRAEGPAPDLTPREHCHRRSVTRWQGQAAGCRRRAGCGVQAPGRMRGAGAPVPTSSFQTFMRS